MPSILVPATLSIVIRHQRALRRLLLRSPLVSAALGAVAELAPPDWWLGAGAVAQTVWNDAHGFDPTHGIRDLDVIYFDPDDLTKAGEEHVERALRDALPNVTAGIDVTNEARVHLWYEERFGRPLAPYRSATHAILTWPTTATSVGVKLVDQRLTVCAPFGLRDLFTLTVRPNKTLVTREVYESKASRWAETWPKLSVVPW
jgi:uncharacterized protein